MDGNAQARAKGLTAGQIVVVLILIGLAALGGWWFTSRAFQQGPSSRSYDDRPPIIVQGGSAVIDVPFPGSNGDKGEWEPIGNGKYMFKHALGGAKSVINVVTPASACGDYKAVRKGDLTFTLSNKAGNGESWSFDLRNNGGNLMVVPNVPEIFIEQAGTKLTITVRRVPADPATKVETALTNVEPQGNTNSAKKCTFVTPTPSVEIIQIS